MEVKKDEKVKDTNSSGKPVTKMPKARKSALPISKQSQEVVAKNMGLPPSNLTVKLPDFEAPIKLNSSMLEELSNLGRSGKSKPLGGQRTRASMGGSLNLSFLRFYFFSFPEVIYTFPFFSSFYENGF
jgi:hypothetical protein